MAFQNKNLSVIAYANGFTLWRFFTTDNINEVLAPGYFDKIYNLAATGDIIIVSARKNGNNISSIRAFLLEDGTIKLKELY